jgi:hypothetical protein
MGLPETLLVKAAALEREEDKHSGCAHCVLSQITHLQTTTSKATKATANHQHVLITRNQLLNGTTVFKPQVFCRKRAGDPNSGETLRRKQKNPPQPAMLSILFRRSLLFGNSWLLVGKTMRKYE